MPTADNRKPSLLSRLVRRLLILLYRWKGWRVDGRRPEVRKFIQDKYKGAVIPAF